jgi:hypothetical protein
MKSFVLLLFSCFAFLAATAQQQLRIHHINIENGDATFIGIYDVAAQKYTSKILIDGGQSTPQQMLLPYLKKMIGSDPASLHFDYVVLTHYHNDHYNGLLALKNGSITADSIIDPGGYKVNTVFLNSAVAGKKPDSLTVAPQWLTALKAAARHNPPYVKGRSKVLIQYGTNASTDISNKITIGAVGDNNVDLQCIAGWGNTLSENGEIDANHRPKKTNANNFTLSFILTCGEFRYFIGGDMGGEDAGNYVDQETTVTTFLQNQFPSASSMEGDLQVKGHLCGFKANHHGSNHSNTQDFIEGMRPSVTVTSAGNNKNWHLPHPDYLQRLSSVTPISASSALSDSTFSRGVYFTNLYNFTGFPSKTKANTLFNNKEGISYDVGNNSTTAKGSYMITVREDDALNDQSVFEVGRIDISGSVPYKRLALFFCHKK